MKSFHFAISKNFFSMYEYVHIRMVLKPKDNIFHLLPRLKSCIIDVTKRERVSMDNTFIKYKPPFFFFITSLRPSFMHQCTIHDRDILLLLYNLVVFSTQDIKYRLFNFSFVIRQSF